MRNSTFPLFLAALTALAFGCKKDEIAVYRLAKDGPTDAATAIPGAASMGAPMEAPAGEAPMAAAAPALAWDVPGSWKQLPASGMRLASFLLQGHNKKEADISVVSLPGDAGGALANVNRWRGQIGLPPLDSDRLEALTKRVPSAAGSAILVDFVSEEPLNGAARKTRVLGSILSSNGMSWFIKMSGQDDVVAAAKPSFLKFLKSLRPNA